MVYYEPIKVISDALDLVEIIIDVVMRHHKLQDLIVTDRESLFTLKFSSLLCYFLGIKRKLLTAFHAQTNGQTERQNSTMKTYLQAFVNFKQNNWANLLPMAEFAYNNAKNASTGYTLFELNCGYHPRVFYEKEEILDPCSKSKTTEKLSSELWELMIVFQQNAHHTQEL